MKNIMILSVLVLCTLLVQSCTSREKITEFSQLAGKEFAVPTGTMADQLVLSKFPDAKFQYYNSVLDACMAVQVGKADAAAYDEPTLRNIMAKVPGLKMFQEMITVDEYGYAVALENTPLKAVIDSVLTEVKSSGRYDEMLARWLPQEGAPRTMPEIVLDGGNGVLRFGTAAITEPFSFIDGSQKIVGMDIEIASLVAQRLGKTLEVINMDFGAMIPALISGKVDMIGACITISPERAKSVLFSAPYYNGGIAALVAE